ncbi:sigmaY antisigma factor component, partial [Clostridium sp. UBA6640]|uniref:sigmaY antisigma factor component n=1 Tax=Clostridium sp. UBA6640 TaxID=1946370 RepID=UPI0025BF64D2
VNLMDNKIIYIYIPICIILIIQGTWVFRDARKRGNKYYWLWGLLCSINIPTNLILYLIARKIIEKKKINS